MASDWPARTNVGVIGTGSMGSAMVKGWLLQPDAGVDLSVWDKIPTATDGLGAWGPVAVAGSMEELARRADVLFVVVKPKDAQEVLGALAPLMHGGQAVVSAMAGLPLRWLRQQVGDAPGLFRIMPNLGVEMGAGAVALAVEPETSATAVDAVVALLRPLGYVEVVDEDLFDAVTAVSGSSPAFLALAIEALEDGAVAAGLSRQAAREWVRGAALEAARELPAQADSPRELLERHATLSEEGRAGLRLLDERRVRTAFQEAVEAALLRSRQMRRP